MRQPVQFPLQLLFWLMLGGAGLFTLFRWMKTVPAEQLIPGATALAVGVLAGAIGGLVFWNFTLSGGSNFVPVAISMSYLTIGTMFFDTIWMYVGGLAAGMLLCVVVDSFAAAIHALTPAGKKKPLQQIRRPQPRERRQETGITSLSSATAMHDYAAAGKEGQVLGLLNLGVEADTRDERGRTPLHCAAAGGHLKVLLQLLAHKVRIDPADLQGCTPLHLAVAGGHGNVVLALMKAGADLQARDHEGHTPRELAEAIGADTIAKLLVSRAN